MSDRREQGAATRRRVLGEGHVGRSEAERSDFDGPFLDLITEAAWGHVWSRDTIPLRERSMLTIAILAGLGNWEELTLHLRATKNTGASRQDVAEALLHVAIYAGVPRANHAFKVARQVLDEMEDG